MKAQGPGAPTAQLDPVGDVEWRKVAVDPPVLQLARSIPTPAALARDPEAWVAHQENQPAAEAQRPPRGCKRCLEVIHVLNAQQKHRRALPSLRRTTLLPCPNSSGRRGFGSVLSAPPVPRLPRALRGNGTRAGSARRKQQPPRTPERRGRSFKRGGVAGGGCDWMTARQARRERGTLPPNQLRWDGTLTFRQCYAASLIHIRESPPREASGL